MEVYLILLFVVSVNSVAIQGPEYTRYVPCGLGIIYFDKVANLAWRGVINFRLYPNISDAQIEIGFETPTQISWVSFRNYYNFIYLK